MELTSHMVQLPGRFNDNSCFASFLDALMVTQAAMTTSGCEDVLSDSQVLNIALTILKTFFKENKDQERYEDFVRVLARLVRDLDKKGSIDRIFGPMGLFASSFSSKTISDKTLAMNTAVDELREAADSLAIAAAGKTSGGFLGFGEKKLDESQRAQLAKAAYAKGISAIDKFIMIGNDGLGMQFAPIETIQ